jgi:hypothetical protein
VASIRKDILVAARPEQVWSAVRDVGAVHRRLVPGRLVDARLEGDARILTFGDGGVARELIVDVDDAARRLAYAVVAGRMPLTHHHATMQVLAEGTDGSRLVWITDLLPDTLAPEVRARVDVGANVMRETLEAEAARLDAADGRRSRPPP